MDERSIRLAIRQALEAYLSDDEIFRRIPDSLIEKFDIGSKESIDRTVLEKIIKEMYRAIGLNQPSEVEILDSLKKYNVDVYGKLKTEEFFSFCRSELEKMNIITKDYAE